MMTVGLIAGLLTATAVVAAVVGLAPRPVPLAARLHTILHPDTPPPQRWPARILARLSGSDPPLDADLAVTGSTVEQLTARRLVWAAAGLATPGLVWPAGLATLGVPWAAAPVAGIGAAAGGWWLARHELHDTAAKRRAELAVALAAYLQLAATMIRAGTAEEQALQDAAGAGSGWTFTMISDAIRRAVTAGAPLAQGFDQLGTRIAAAELRALAAELHLAARQGSSPAPILAARAAALRDQQLAEIRAAAGRTERRMAAPLVGLGLCVIVFIVFPAVTHLVNQ